MNALISRLDTLPSRRPARTRWAAPAALLALAAWAFGWQSYPLYVLTQVLVYGIAILSLNLLTGYTGQVSLGHGTFFALGAYGTAVLATQLGWPIYLSIPAATALCGVVGFLVGFPALRLPMLYLALSTFAVAVATPQTLKWNHIRWLTGGVQGLVLSRPEFPGVLAGKADWCIAVCAGACALGAFLLARRILHSQFGRLVDASRDQPLAATAGGLDVTAIKTQMFGLSAAYTGLAGALSVFATQFASPESFPFLLSVSLLVGSFVGGVRSLGGAFSGAAFIVLTPNLAESMSRSAPWLVFGLALMAVVFIAPEGIGGLGDRLKRFWCRRPSPAEYSTTNPDPS